MKNFLNKLYQNHALVYKLFLFIATTVLIVYLFPKGGYFKFDLQKGKIWQFEDLYAPFDFAIQKTEDEINIEKLEIQNNKTKYFILDTKITENVLHAYDVKIDSVLNTFISNKLEKNIIKKRAKQFLVTTYKKGFATDNLLNDKVIIIRGNEAEEVYLDHILKEKNIHVNIDNYFSTNKLRTYSLKIKTLYLNIIKPNIIYSEEFTQSSLNEKLNKISFTKGKITKDELIIARGNIVEGQKFKILNSLKNEYETQQLSGDNYYWLIIGYTILVALVLMMLLLFLRKYRLEIFEDNNKTTFIFFNILLMVFLITITIKLKPTFLYAVPLIILPIVIKAFFDARLGLFTHVLTVLILGFIVPNNFEFIFLQIIAGIVTILTVSELYKRANLFISISQITFTYMLAYFAFFIIQEGTASNIKGSYFALFALNGVLALLSQYLIWIYEKIFGLISDVSLLELSNTNSKLLRELNEKAPGTFQHSMQVANIAETSANEIGANAMLVRTGALYHDIGKMLNPMYFTENQSTSLNPHHELAPKDSAKIIIDHVIKGIELAKKHGLPDHIIDFIRTHHGVSLVYYFYKKQQELTPENTKIEDFQYPGPIPFSKETAILMMADASEAASKSLKEPTAQRIDDLIDKVIDGQMNNGQFMNSDITFREIQLIKKVIKKKLKNIYHVRVEYPE
ncbi:MAG: HDIG domain-containing protein [Flavobacteriaceae bacterium]|nr:HDIG domain-containing protein [Flavobacteriaceae bacterium]